MYIVWSTYSIYNVHQTKKTVKYFKKYGADIDTKKSKVFENIKDSNIQETNVS